MPVQAYNVKLTYTYERKKERKKEKENVAVLNKDRKHVIKNMTSNNDLVPVCLYWMFIYGYFKVNYYFL